MKDYKACFAHLSPLPFYHYDYTIPWHFKAADTTAPNDFASLDARSVDFKMEGAGVARMVHLAVLEPLPRPTPVCLWDAVPNDENDLKGFRVFHPPMLDDRRVHTVLELPKGWKGRLDFGIAVKSEPPKAEFGGLVTPLWRVQMIGPEDRRQAYAFIDVPLLSPCTVTFTVPRDCRIDSLEKPLGAFKKGDRVDLTFGTRRTWFRFWGLAAEEIQPDAAGVKAIEKAAAEWQAFSSNREASLKEIHEKDDAFFKSVVPADEKLLLDIDCFGNALFGERSRALPFDRTVYSVNGKLTAREYCDGGISYGKGKSFWMHPRGLHFNIEGLDTLDLPKTAKLRVRLCTVAEKDEDLSYSMAAKSGWKKIFGFLSAQDSKPSDKVIWNCPKTRTADGLFTFDFALADVCDEGWVTVYLRTNQKQVLDDWFADKGFISRLERVVVTRLK